MNCIWITVDSFRQDHLRCYRPQGTSDPTGKSLLPHTPNIDRLASEGLRCDRLRSDALPSVPCRCGIFTGRRVFPRRGVPARQGEEINASGWPTLPDEEVTVAEHLARHGYVCALVSDCCHLMEPGQNFHRGFHCYHWERGQEQDRWQSQPLPPGRLERYLKEGTSLSDPRVRILAQYLKNQMYRQGDEEFQAARVFRRAIEWLERNHTHERFYLHIECFDPHEPWDAPQRLISLYDPRWGGPHLIYPNLWKRNELTDAEHHHIRARYAAECSLVDHWVGRLMSTVERLGLVENTLIVFLSDHGKIIGEFNHYGMAPEDTSLELNSVPCIIRHPKGELAGGRYAGWFYNTDVTATALSLLGVEPKPLTEGESFWPAAASNAEFRDHAVVCYQHVLSCWQDDWLLLVDTARNTTELYHLGEDPHREKDVAARYPEIRDSLQRRIEAVMAAP